MLGRLLAGTFALLAASGAAQAQWFFGDTSGFRNATPVEIWQPNGQRYLGEVTNPFITPDKRFLIFADPDQSEGEFGRSTPPRIRFAERFRDHSFRLQGEVPGANYVVPDGSADGVTYDSSPSMSNPPLARFCQISWRAFYLTRASVICGRWTENGVVDQELMTTLRYDNPLYYVSDAEVTFAGDLMLYTRSVAQPQQAPSQADLHFARLDGTRFVPAPEADGELAKVNSPTQLEYAGTLACDNHEIFFTRAAPGGGPPSVWYAVRDSSGNFGEPRRVKAVEGYAESPSLTWDKKLLYYAVRVGGRYEARVVSRVTFPGRACGSYRR